MTKEDLIDKHFDVCEVNGKSSGVSEHTKVSIEYAISVLEELRYEFATMKNGLRYPVRDVEHKIQELKTLIYETK